MTSALKSIQNKQANKQIHKQTKKNEQVDLARLCSLTCKRRRISNLNLSG